MMDRLQARKGGFTLVETLVAITVLVIAVVGPLYAVHKSVTASYTARDSLIATALAQESVEYIRKVRDSNYLSGQSDWLNGLDTCMLTGPGQDEGPNDYGCGPDIFDGSLTACLQNGCPRLRLDNAYRYRQLATGTDSRFARKVTIKEMPSGNEAEIIVRVSWVTLRVQYTVTVTERLYNWQ
jgi:prepilin-type N-terminal cleavage/methylation domain-containing protein